MKMSLNSFSKAPKKLWALTTNTQPVMLVAGVAAVVPRLAEGGRYRMWWPGILG